MNAENVKKYPNTDCLEGKEKHKKQNNIKLAARKGRENRRPRYGGEHRAG